VGRLLSFYRNELFVSVNHTLALAEAYRGKLLGKPLPPDLPIKVLPKDPYVVIKAYQDGRRVKL
jgi:hypothetical protein